MGLTDRGSLRNGSQTRCSTTARDEVMSLFLPFAVWLGVLATCSLVGACLGVVGRLSVGGGSRRLVIALGLPASLVGYSFAMYRLLSAFVEANYSAPAFPRLGATLATSWGVAALMIGALKTPRAVLAGSLIGMATAVCAVGPGFRCSPTTC